MVFTISDYIGKESLLSVVASILQGDSAVNERDTACETRFVGMVERHKSLITKICYYFASSREEFQDLRQDVLLNLWRGIGSFRGDSSATTWIYRVCFNTCVTSMSRRSKDVSVLSIEDVSDESEFVDSHDTTKMQRIELLHRCILMLSPLDRSVVMMQLDGMSYDEIGEVCGLNRNTVATRLRRAKQRLAELMTNKLRNK